MTLRTRNSLALVLYSWVTLFSSPILAQQCPQVLLATDALNQINQGQSIEFDGIVLVQQFGGNLQVYTGTSNNLDCLIWESGLYEVPSNQAFHFSKIRERDGLLFTVREGETTTRPFKRGGDGPKGTYYFIVSCDGTVGIYNSEQPSKSSEIWSSPGNQCGLPSTSCQRTVLMGVDDRVLNDAPKQGTGAFIKQESNGNLVVQRGTTTTPGEILWQSCDQNNTVTNYFTALQSDSQFITRPVSDESAWIWKRDDFVANTTKNWELALTCNGDDYDKLVISDTEGLTVAWEQDLRPSCETSSKCPTGILLLDTNKSIGNGTKLDTGKGYFLEQASTGSLILWKGAPATPQCMLWKSTPLKDLSVNGTSRTVMQGDGNLVSYGQEASETSERPIWDTQTGAPQEANYALVIDNCRDDSPSISIYKNNPVTDSNAEAVWFSQFTDSCTIRRDLALRGSH